MKRISILFFIALIQISVNAQIVRDSLKTKVIYTSREIENRYVIQLSSSPVSIRKIEKECKKTFKINNGNYRLLREKLIKDSLKKIDAEQADFMADFNKINQRGINGKNHKQKIIYQYKSAFNGFAIDADSLTLKEIRKIRHIKKIFRDRIIRINDNASNDVIRAPQVWQQTGATGKNIKIGILDTGIDPDHPDLAGKVLRGYDFVNNDTIPFDDHGHGTHCAGIAAANGLTLKGVAPGALLMPIKVLDAEGSGYWSNIIAGVNYAIDPDSNALTDDGVKILSISLGGPGSPDDPVAQAINNAFEKNVLCVVAAGNEGTDYYTIGTPGCAENALTVGATDNNDNLAYFSSCGPVRGTFQVKPEVLAPGVNIYSTLPGGEYASWSGTSMATPHVSGAAALLMELHPEWTPSEVKSALMASARDLGMEIWKQGKGRIDVLKATQIKTLINPGIISFGNVSDSTGIWSASKNVKIFNYMKQSVTYSLSLGSPAPKGTSFSFPSDVITSDTTSFIVSVDVNIDSADFPNSTPSYLSGELVLTSIFDTTRIQYTINKCKTLQITFDKVPDMVYLSDFGGELIQPIDTILYYDFDYEKDVDIITYFDYLYTIVAKENIHLNNNSKLMIASADAINKIVLKAVDENNQQLKISDGHEVLYCPKNSGLLITLRFGINSYSDSIIRRISNISNNYIYNYMPTSFSGMNPQHRYYEIPFQVLNGVYNDTTLINSASDFIKVVRKFPKLKLDNNTYASRHRIDGTKYSTFGELNCVDYGFSLNPDNTSVQYMIPRPKDNFFLNFLLLFGFNRMAGSSPDFLQDATLFKSGNEILVDKNNLEIGTGEASCYVNRDISFPIRNNQFNIEYGLVPTHYSPNFIIKDKTLSLITPYHSFMFSFNDIMPGSIDCELLKGNVPDTSFTVNNNSFFEGLDGGNLDVKLDSGLYCLEQVYRKGIIDTLSSVSKACYKFNSSKNTVPKRINKIILKSDSVITNHLKKNAVNTIEIASQSNKIQYVFIKLMNDSVWHNIQMNKIDSNSYSNNYNYAYGIDTNFLYSGQLPVDLKLGYYSLRLIVPSYSGDTMTYSVDPAFVFYSDSCYKSDSSTVYPNVIISSSDADNKICIGDSLTLSARGANIYKWSTSQDISTITVDSSGVYSVIGSNLYGCSDTATINIYVNPIYNITKEVELCEGDSYNGHSTNGTYIDYLKSVTGCDSIVTTDITLRQLPKPELGKDTSIYTNQSLQLDPGSFSSYLWSDGSTNESILFSGSIGAGIYSKWVKVTDDNMCSNSDTINIHVTKALNIEFLTDGVIIKLFPNPVNGLLNIVVMNAPNIDYAEVYDIAGKLVSKLKFASGPDLTKTAQFDVTSIPNGMYVLQIQSKVLNVARTFTIQ